MTSGVGSITITIRKRAWWFWCLAGLWLLLEVFFVQTSVASVGEGEYRAAAICGIITGLLGVFGCLAWLRRGRQRKVSESGGQAQAPSPVAPAAVIGPDPTD